MARAAAKRASKRRPRRVQPENWVELLAFGNALKFWAETGVDSPLSMTDRETALEWRMAWNRIDESKLRESDALLAARIRERWKRGRRKGAGTTLTVETIAKCLIAVAKGEDARAVFRQVARPGRQQLRWYHENVAMDYWYWRVEGETRSRALLIAKSNADARAREYGFPILANSSIARHVRTHRDSCLRVLESDGDPRVAKVRAELALHSRRGRE